MADTSIKNGTEFKYGTDDLGTITGIVVQTYDVKDAFALKVEGKDTFGRVVGRRYVDATQTLGITALVPAAATPPAKGTIITVKINGADKKFFVEDTSYGGRNDGNATYNLNCIASEGVSLT